MDDMKIRMYIANKYKTKIEIPKEMNEFKEKHPTEEFERHDTENLISNLNQETRESYHKNSKMF